MSDGSGDDLGGRVVVVDDEQDVADLYGAYLGETYDVRTAYNGEQALEQIDDTVDVVLLDRRMPDLSGDEVLERVRDRGHDCRVVLVTAVEPDFDIVDMPFEEYVTKPVTRDELQEVVEEQMVLDAYDSRLREYLRKRAKLAILEEQKPPAELADNDRYNELKVVTESLREEIEEMLDRHDDVEIDPEEIGIGSED